MYAIFLKGIFLLDSIILVALDNIHFTIHFYSIQCMMQHFNFACKEQQNENKNEIMNRVLNTTTARRMHSRIVF